MELFESQNRAIALIGIPWYNVIGNHDVNRDAPDDATSDETFERTYGPSYYSFDYGSVHFIVLDDVEWYVDGEKGRYRGGLHTDQVKFVENDLGLIPKNQLVVLMMHVPLTAIHNRQSLYRLIEQRPFSMSISGHTHYHQHRLIGREDGWRGAEPHHHVINVTVSGSWWSGRTDERGIPHALMPDGAPNGYSIISFDGSEYRLDYKAARKPASYQMRIDAPETIVRGEDADVYVNVFNASPESKVELRVGNDGAWQLLNQTRENDPQFLRLFEAEKPGPGDRFRELPKPRPSGHLWKASLKWEKSPGTYLIQARTTDRHGRVFQSQRSIRVLQTSSVAPGSDETTEEQNKESK